MTFRHLATSPAGVVRQLAVSYIAHGHFFYVAGSIPPGKSREAVDQKLISLHGIDQSRWKRCRRKLAGWASVHYIRCDSFFILIASHGTHEFFELEENVVRDVRREPIAFAGDRISHRRGVDGKGHPSVRIHSNEYRWLKQYMTEVAKRAPTEAVLDEFRMLRFEACTPVAASSLASPGP